MIPKALKKAWTARVNAEFDRLTRDGPTLAALEALMRISGYPTLAAYVHGMLPE
jgi:hypothetical protein